MTARGKQWRGLLGCPSGAIMLGLLFLFVVAQHAVPLQGAATSRAPQTQQKSSAARGTTSNRELHKIAETVAKAVLDKNVETLLSYDRADLRSADGVSLKNPKSDLYCYLFDSECITWGDGSWRSVYDKLSQARQLEIKVSVFSSRYDRQLYGNVFFYDASAISDKNLRSRDFLCKEGPASIATWKFRLEGGKWKSVNPLFDSETRDCPNPPEEGAK